MSRPRFFLFLSLALSVYLSFSTIVFLYGWHAFASVPTVQMIFAFVFWILTPLFFIARGLEFFTKGNLVRVLLLVGSFWLALLVYFTVGIFFFEILGSILYYFQPLLFEQFLALSPIFALSTILLSIILAVIWWIHAHNPKLRSLEYNFSRGDAPSSSFRIVAASDIHLGTIIGKKRFDRLVTQINSLHPDLVFFVGDTIDEDIEPVIHQDIGTSIRRIKSRLWVFAVNGNHEYIGWVERADAYLIEHGVQVLRDTSICIDDSFTLVGREDISSRAFTGTARKTLKELLLLVPSNLPIMLLDHQPSWIRETADDGRVALQLSGHTHHGQLWPFSLVTRGIFEISWGAKKIGKTEFYVSCGWGTWGPPVRIGNTAELLDIRINFI